MLVGDEELNLCCLITTLGFLRQQMFPLFSPKQGYDIPVKYWWYIQAVVEVIPEIG